MITLSDITQAFRNASESEREDFLNVLIPVFEAKVTKIVETVLNTSFDSRLLMSDLRPVKRISELELITGLDEYEDEDRAPSIPERIQTLEDKISSTDFRPTVNPQIDKIPETKTEIRASLLVDALKASKKDYFSANDIMDFLKCKLPDSCKIDEKVKNVRKVKQDVVKKAEEMFSYLVESNKKTTGHRDIRLVLKS